MSFLFLRTCSFVLPVVRIDQSGDMGCGGEAAPFSGRQFLNGSPQWAALPQLGNERLSRDVGSLDRIRTARTVLCLFKEAVLTSVRFPFLLGAREKMVR